MLKEPVRILAAAAWASGGYNKALALERFQEMMQKAGLPMPKCPEKAIKRWGEQLKKQQNVRGGPAQVWQKAQTQLRTGQSAHQAAPRVEGSWSYCSLCQHSAVLCGQPHSKANQGCIRGRDKDCL